MARDARTSHGGGYAGVGYGASIYRESVNEARKHNESNVLIYGAKGSREAGRRWARNALKGVSHIRFETRFVE